nr:hypothetical protein [uncultured Lichenicoccus sp.]
MSDTTRTLPSMHDVVDHAWSAYHAADWTEAFVRWEAVRGLFPSYAPACVHGGNALREAGHLEQALAHLTHGAVSFPDEVQLVTQIAVCLLRMKRYDTCATLLEEAVPRFPGNPEVAIDLLRLWHDLGDHPAVLRASELMRGVHPGTLDSDAGVRHMVSSARLAVETDRIDALIASAVPPSLHARDAMAAANVVEGSSEADRRLMLSFESLGENCEFGLVQRHFRAEPLGLLRWSAISVGSLTLALDEEFEGVGTAQHTRLHAGDTEYSSTHDRYGMGSHTFIPINAKNEPVIFDRLVTRLAYLRRNLIEDLRSDDRIFVYSCEEGITAADLRELHRAVKRYGSRKLLVVLKSDASHAPGSVHDLGDGLMMGYNDRLGPERTPAGHAWKVSYQNWLAICRAASDLFRLRQTVPVMRQQA